MLIDPAIHRDVIRGHLVRCESCDVLLRFARERGDREVLAAWRVQLAAHLETEQARRAHDSHARRTLCHPRAFEPAR